MRFKDILRLSFISLSHRRLRSWLTIIGIVIGVATVVTLISLAQGIQDSITSELSFFGANMIDIIPGHYKALQEAQFGGMMGGKVGNLTENDIRVLKGIYGVDFVSGYKYEKVDVSYGSQVASTTVTAFDPKTFEYMESLKIEEGRPFVKGDTYVAVIGYKIAHDTFKKDIELNNQIKINDRTFRVIGIMKEGGAFGSLDSMIFIPEDIGGIVLETDEIDELLVVTSDEADNDYVVDQITKKLLSSHHVREEDQDFTIITSKSVEETVGRITSLLSFFFGTIAAISLLVGGIGIANTMFMSVMERTREIGILKALGSTDGEITKLFLIESGLIGMVGGLIGIVFGFIAAFTISQLGVSTLIGTQLVPRITIELVLFAMGFSLLVGIFSGLFPARRAASLEPVEALRYE